MKKRRKGINPYIQPVIYMCITSYEHAVQCDMCLKSLHCFRRTVPLCVPPTVPYISFCPFFMRRNKHSYISPYLICSDITPSQLSRLLLCDSCSHSFFCKFHLIEKSPLGHIYILVCHSYTNQLSLEELASDTIFTEQEYQLALRFEKFHDKLKSFNNLLKLQNNEQKN